MELFTENHNHDIVLNILDNEWGIVMAADYYNVQFNPAGSHD